MANIRSHRTIPNLIQPSSLSGPKSPQLDEGIAVESAANEPFACEECDADEDLTYCSACTEVLCNPCWDRRKKHRDNRPGPGGIPHEKNGLYIVENIRQRTAEPQNTSEETALHEQDEDTTWIGFDRDSGGDPVLAEYRRYAAIMMASATQDSGNRYPRLVSFIGETAAGKSTLIKLLLGNEDALDHTGASAPVIGRGGLERPTSADVHLYLDSATASTDYPILLADCEGFNGGEGDPIAVQPVQEALADDRQHKMASSSKRQQRKESRMHEVIQRPLQWARRENAATEEKRKRSYAISQMYPRIFYAFSDVVVYVLKNPKTLEEVVEKLLNWAHTHRAKSINIPTKPHVVIAINQSHHSTPAEQWDTAYATAHLLSSTTAKINKNETFQRYADEKQNANFNVTNMRDLLKCYYYDIHVVRLPDKDRFELLYKQAQTLYTVIADCCDESTQYKKAKRMLPDVDQLGLYLKMAFDHFAHSLDVPFDYIEASLRHRPPPAAFNDNLSIFTIMVAKHMECFEQRGAANEKLFDTLTPMVASCIMLDCSRKQRFGMSKDWFSNSITGQNTDSYRELCATTIDAYCREYIPCGQILRKASTFHRKDIYCNLRKLTHEYEHRPIEVFGKYEVSFDHEAYDWPGRILSSLRELENVYARSEGSALVHVRATTHQKRMRDFYGSLGGAHLFKANSLCLCCLSGPPEHHLPCGHFLCTGCLRDYSRQSDAGLEIDGCPLHNQNAAQRITTAPTVIRSFPRHSGLRVLVLDGGGARGIVELAVMQAIEKRLDVPLQAFFDLVIGTSTGGIIALGFGDQAWPVDKCIETFKSLVKSAFTLRNLQARTYVLKYVQMFVKRSKYRSGPMAGALKDAFGEETVLFGSQGARGDHRRLKVGVTATTTAGNDARLLANFFSHGSTHENDPFMKYQHVRPTNPDHEFKVWEAARSTSAAPGFFKPFDKQCQDEPFDDLMDGGVLQNNPINIAYQEARNIAAIHELSDTPDIVLSLGTGLPKEYQIQEKHTKPLHHIRAAVREKKPFLSVIFNVIENQVKFNLDSEKRWQDWERNICQAAPAWEGKRFRLNPDLGMEPPPMDKWDMVPAMETWVRGWVGQEGVSKHIDSIVRTLVSSSFYFERTGTAFATNQSNDHLVHMNGFIKCRLSDAPEDIRGLGRFLQNCWTTSSRAVFLIENPKGGSFEVEPPISSMVERGLFEPLQLHLEVPAEQTENNIALSIDGHAFPISGFPRCLMKQDFGMA